MDMRIYEKYDIISFDIFDTLIKRNVNHPHDIFTLVENGYNEKHKDKISNFKNVRIISERECRNVTNREITLDEIYANISKKYSTKIASDLKKIEIDVEISLCQRNKDKLINNIYEWAHSNKKVVITSDMYLPIKVIKTILKNNEIEYNKIYLSSEIGLKKSTSKLFQYVLKDLNIEPSKLLHIGDNIHSDIKMSRKQKIDSVLVGQKIDINPNNSKNIHNNINSNINFNILYTFIQNNMEENNNDYFYNFGYKYFGPLLYSFSIWLNENLKKENIKKVFFLARDGKIIENAFNIINNESEINSQYMMASRRSIIVPSLWKNQNIYEIFEKINIPPFISINDLTKRVGLDDVKIDDLLNKYSLNQSEKINFELLKKDYKDFLEELYPLIIENSKKEYKALENYLSLLNFNGKVAIVDIGWYGNMQLALENIVEKKSDIYGYYIGLRPNKKDKIKSYGYLFDKDKNIDINEFEFSMNAIFEFIFSATHGSVKRFVSSKERYELYDNENDNEYETKALNSLQKGAIVFVNDFFKSQSSKFYMENVNSAVFLLKNLLLYPSRTDAQKIGDLQFKDAELIYIAKGKKMHNYIFSPQKFVKDLKNSTWKIGFMKRTFVIKLPYDKIFYLLKK